MRWPWVSRVVAEMQLAVIGQRDAEIARLRAGLKEFEANANKAIERTAEIARAQYDALMAITTTERSNLTDKLLQLKLAGATLPEPRPMPVHKEPDILRSMVVQRTAGKPALQKLALAQLARDRLDPTLTEEDIMRRIDQGEQADGVPE